ncbi:MAG TPA: acyl-CoA dehydrogenase family protein [Vicinamibacterales bacterium]|jgi:alkylation response protein AidB-like acyl-CoA dehydrogenase
MTTTSKGSAKAGHYEQPAETGTHVPTRKGGSWLLEETPSSEVFTPGRLTDEHRMMARTTAEFVEAEVLPNLDRLETKDWELARKLVRRCGELGLLGIQVPEEYGGLDLDKTSSLVVVEQIGPSASFATTFGGQANLCVLPLVLFGTPEQKEKYLPRLVSGEMVGAYALSESGSGSDALAAKTRATKQPDGSWMLNGEKMWISNGGFADVIIVFAKVDGEQFTAFIVERAFPGVSSGKEEHKMGLHGSSTTPIILQDAKVPAGNVLGEIGKGHKVALNTLNYGRFSLGAMCNGGARAALADAASYASSRRQFGQPIANFGAIKHKLGEMYARIYAVESLVYRSAGLIDALLSQGPRSGAAVAAAFEEFAIEASISKVAGSETLNYVLDENIQIHGGNGFVKDYQAERFYRDARVNRIFEGTNEINRLLIPGMLIRRALKGDLPLIAAAKRLQDEVLSPSVSGGVGSGDELDEELRAVAAFKKVALMVLGTAMQTYGEGLTDQQEVLSYAADILIDIYSAESAVLRAREALAQQQPKSELHVAAARVFVNDAAQRVDNAARSALAAMAEGDTLRTLLAALRRVLKVTPINTVALRRTLADAATENRGYVVA